MSDDITPVQDRATDLRSKIEAIKIEVAQFRDDLINKDVVEVVEGTTDKGEQIANVILSFRHLEDAKMRLGLVIGATVGKSVYDTPAPAENTTLHKITAPY